VPFARRLGGADLRRHVLVQRRAALLVRRLVAVVEDLHFVGRPRRPRRVRLLRIVRRRADADAAVAALLLGAERLTHSIFYVQREVGELLLLVAQEAVTARRGHARQQAVLDDPDGFHLVAVLELLGALDDPAVEVLAVEHFLGVVGGPQRRTGAEEQEQR